jgi:hypothetical protein
MKQLTGAAECLLTLYNELPETLGFRLSASALLAPVVRSFAAVRSSEGRDN